MTLLPVLANPLSVRLEGGNRLNRKLTALEREVLPKSSARALNRTATTARKEAVKDVRIAMGIKASPVRGAMLIIRATAKKLVAIIKVSGAPLSLRHFGARQVRKGVSHKAYGRRQIAKGAFMALPGTNRKGTSSTIPQAFTRKRGTRLPIKKLWGPSIPKTMADDAILNKLHALINRVYPERLERELKFFVSRLAAKR